MKKRNTGKGRKRVEPLKQKSSQERKEKKEGMGTGRTGMQENKIQKSERKGDKEKLQ